ncbi:hypothetical protein ACOMHN_024144 [Nucella lapillus]
MSDGSKPSDEEVGWEGVSKSSTEDHKLVLRDSDASEQSGFLTAEWSLKVSALVPSLMRLWLDPSTTRSSFRCL